MSKKLTISDINLEIKLLSLLFLVSVFAGLLTFQTPPLFVVQVLNELSGTILELADQPTWQLFSFILINNLVAIIFTIVGGLVFGILPLMSAGINGYIIGVVAGQVMAQGEGAALLAGLLPHGIIEIPALILALSLGLFLGRVMWRSLRTRSKILIWPACMQVFGFTWQIVVPLIVMAALVEAYLTPSLINLVY